MAAKNCRPFSPFTAVLQVMLPSHPSTFFLSNIVISGLCTSSPLIEDALAQILLSSTTTLTKQVSHSRRLLLWRIVLHHIYFGVEEEFTHCMTSMRTL